MQRQGFTKLEMVASATLLATMFGIASPLFSRLNQVWHTTRLYQLASQELMNQMETLIHLSREECEDALQQLAIAPEIVAVIPEAQLTGNLDTSDDGDRVLLAFRLPSSVRMEPILLVGWLQQGRTP